MQSNISLDTVYWNNTVFAYLSTIAGIVLAWLVLQVFKRWILKGFKNLAGSSKTNFDDALISAAEKFVIPYAYVLINYIILSQLVLSPKVSYVLRIAMIVVTIFFAVRVVNHATHIMVHLYMRRNNEAEARIFQLNGILNVIKVIMWGIGLLFLLDNLGYDVTTIVAGLGIGGIAVALAAQNILSDLFSYFVIFFDKPFEIGDFVMAGDKSGTVEQIGIKTSRIRTLAGEELVMPNAELVKSPIHNFKRQVKRRIAFNLRIAYSTPPAVLKQVPVIIKEIIDGKPGILFDRSHLQSLGDTYINFETVYNVSTSDYMFYMSTQQEIYLEILEAFKKIGIEFSLPIQNIFIGENGEQSIKHLLEKNVQVTADRDEAKES